MKNNGASTSVNNNGASTGNNIGASTGSEADRPAKNSKSTVDSESNCAGLATDGSTSAKAPSQAVLSGGLDSADSNPADSNPADSNPAYSNPADSDPAELGSSGPAPSLVNNQESSSTGVADTPLDACPQCGSSNQELHSFHALTFDLTSLSTLIPALVVILIASYWLSLSWAEGISFAIIFSAPLLLGYSKRYLCESCLHSLSDGKSIVTKIGDIPTSIKPTKIKSTSKPGKNRKQKKAPSTTAKSVRGNRSPDAPMSSDAQRTNTGKETSNRK